LSACNFTDDPNVSRKTGSQFVIPFEINDTCFDAKALAAPEIPLRSDRERMWRLLNSATNTDLRTAAWLSGKLLWWAALSDFRRR
jgi:hypothetical protein